MATAALPDYLLRQDLSQASPGLRFGMYLPLWGVNNRTRERLWSTSDINYRVAGQDRQEREFRDENKTAALRQATRLTAADRALMGALAQRQAALAAPMATGGTLLRIEATAVAPFTTGLGNEHPLENGFAFLSPYGLPYLPASGVKGVLRQAARELARGDWGDTAGWSEDRCYLLAVDKQRIPLSMLDALFGKETEDRDTDQVRGALTFWDVFPLLKGDALQVEVMTAHQTHYYQGGQSPHESGSPNPINFLTVPPGSELAFHVRCDIPHLGRLAPDLARDNRWQALLCAAFAHAFQWLGFGAKTAVGYGAMARDLDREAKQRQTWEAQERQAARAEEEQRAEEDRARRLAEMDPLERAIQEFLDTRTDKVQSEISAVIAAVRQGRWAGEERQGVARWLKARMQATKGQWKESSQAKKPEKDKEYQNTLQVNAWLG